MTDNITLPREVVKLALDALEWSWGGEPMGTKELAAITALRTYLAAEQPVAKAWAEGYQQGVKDERTSEASIGIAGFGAKVEPARQNPYGTALAAPRLEVTVDPRLTAEEAAAISAALAAEPTKPITVPKTVPLPPITCGFVDVRFDGEGWFCDKCGKRMSADFEASVRRGSGEKCYLELMRRKAEAVRTMSERNMK